MNIFALHDDPATAARMLCDKHVPKMLLESAQLLCTLARHTVGDEACNKAGLYKSTHAKHPCQLWLREHREHNWAWLWAHVVYIDGEYNKRFKKSHKSFGVAINAAVLLQKHINAGWINYTNHTPFVQCMPEKYRIPNNPVTAYRNYYNAEKSYFAKWERGTPAPEWFKPLEK